MKLKMRNILAKIFSERGFKRVMNTRIQGLLSFPKLCNQVAIGNVTERIMFVLTPRKFAMKFNGSVAKRESQIL